MKRELAERKWLVWLFGRMKEEDEAEENRREAALASNPCLQPNFKSATLTQSQISKFQELHRKRLQIKAKSKKQRKRRDKTLKVLGKDVADKDKASGDDGLTDSSPSNFSDCSCKDGRLTQLDTAQGQPVMKRRQKLYWGLDVKERWERKSNM